MSLSVWAAKKAKIVGDDFEVYMSGDFDSEVIDTVHEGEVYQVSDKPYGPFYRIKLKSGQIGYIVDYALDIEGRGPLKPKDLDEVELSDLKKEIDQNRDKSSQDQIDREQEEASLFSRNLSGPVALFYNYHENTMGSEQIGDLWALGYKSVGLLSWSVAGSWQVPKYYTDPAGYSAHGVQLWADLGISNTVGQSGPTSFRVGANAMTHISIIQLETPARRYDMHDITIGGNLEFAVTVKIKRVAPDISLKYYFDKSQYAAVGFGLLF